MDTQVSNFSLQNMWAAFKRGFRRHGILLVLLTVIGGIIAGCISWYGYTPRYTAATTFTVQVDNSVYSGVSGYNSATADQMEKTFPSILTSGLLNELVMEDLGVDKLPEISAQAVDAANLLELKVTGDDPKFCHRVLWSVINNYPEIAERVVGPTKLTMVDATGIPKAPDNQRSWLGASVKGALIGFVLAAASIFAYGMLKVTIMGRDDIQRISNTKYLGALPSVVWKKRSNEAEQIIDLKTVSNRDYREAFRSVSTHVNKTMEKQGYRVLLVSSAIPGEGKTTVSFNLANAISSKHGKVLLADCDLRNPSIYRMLKQEQCAGITEWLNGKAELSDIIHSVSKRLDVIFAGTPTDDGSEALSSDRFKQLLEALKQSYDAIVLDTPPCSMLADTAELSTLADCSVMVIKQDYASRDSVINGLNNLQESGTPIIGYILNEYEGGVSGRYGYGYGYGQYGYGKSYGKYGYGYGYGYGTKKDKDRDDDDDVIEASAIEIPAAYNSAKEPKKKEIRETEKSGFQSFADKLKTIFKHKKAEGKTEHKTAAQIKVKPVKAGEAQAVKVTAPGNPKIKVKVKPNVADQAVLKNVSEIKVRQPVQSEETEPEKLPEKHVTAEMPEAEAELEKTVESEDKPKAKESTPAKSKGGKHVAKKQRNKGTKILLTIVGILVGIALLLVAAILVLNFVGKKQMTAEQPMNIGETIEYKGKKYRYNEDIASIMLMGVDQYDKAGSTSYAAGKQSDANVLAVLDSENEKISLIAVSRDTFTHFEVFDENGESKGIADAQLALAYSYGDGAEKSCELTTAAVSEIFHDLDIPAYASIYMDGISGLVDMVGGIDITSEINYREFAEGKTISVNGEQALKYIRYRDHTVNGNNGRMERQQQILKILVNKVLKMVREDPKVILDLYQGVKAQTTTNLNAAKMVYLAGQAAKMAYDDNVYTVPGESKMVDTSHAAFVVDDEKLMDKIIELFYIPC